MFEFPLMTVYADPESVEPTQVLRNRALSLSLGSSSAKCCARGQCQLGVTMRAVRWKPQDNSSSSTSISAK